MKKFIESIINKYDLNYTDCTRDFLNEIIEKYELPYDIEMLDTELIVVHYTKAIKYSIILEYEIEKYIDIYDLDRLVNKLESLKKESEKLESLYFKE